MAKGTQMAQKRKRQKSHCERNSLAPTMSPAAKTSCSLLQVEWPSVDDDDNERDDDQPAGLRGTTLLLGISGHHLITLIARWAKASSNAQQQRDNGPNAHGAPQSDGSEPRMSWGLQQQSGPRWHWT